VGFVPCAVRCSECRVGSVPVMVMCVVCVL